MRSVVLPPDFHRGGIVQSKIGKHFSPHRTEEGEKIA